ncbi:hypothetical protein KIW84_024235 [Lathyrus oleraceus]|uniref:Uncharacterized protein n=1 Tax=Pisum sativum TaxID=3888 RepID=A0A9D4YH55_PEA|nr:hypothetical protein KIW84_024235 [Pisum sativum]
MPAHGDVNAVEDASDVCIIKNVEDVKTPLLALHAGLVGARLIDTCHDNCGKPKAAESEKGLKNVDADITNIAGTSRMTRSGRIYTPNFNVNPQEPTREAANVNPTPEHGGAQPTVQTDEASEFLRIIKKSDYKIVDQLHQTPSKISILSLLLNSEAHREALLKVLAQAHVTQDITVGQFDGVVANITTCNTLSFSNEELPKEGKNHNRALHVSIKCQEDALARVLVDTGSSLNVLPKRALAKLSYQGQ